MAEQNVVISEDLCRDLGQFLEGLDYDRLFVLTDENTFVNCYPLLKPVEAIASAPVITVKAGDTHKSLEALASIWTRLSNEGATRHSLLLNLGGGMVTDMGGFAGATFKRGIRTINVPTTLMASVDAAVGGKTGINFNGLKNEIGSFYPPLRVFIDCGFLRTLDYDNILSGYAEMVKHGLISSMEDYASVLLYDIDTMNYSYLNRLVAQSVAVKERIVAEDPKEHGIRKALNFWGNTKAGNKWHMICTVHVRLGQKPGYTPCPNQYKELAMKARTPALLLAAGMLSSALLMAGTDTAQAAPVSDNGFVQLAERHPGPPPGHVRKAPPPPPKKMHKTPPPPPKHDMRRPGPPPKHMAPPPPRHDRPGPPPRHDGRPGPR